MPLINGLYVDDTLGSAKAAQQQVFGKYSKSDMSDFTSAAYNYLMKQQEQAYNLDLWNLANEYNSPAAQMQRYQDAGLNPNLIYSQQNTSQAPSAGAAPTFRSAGTQSKKMQNAINTIQTISALAKSARETYDYLTYGTQTQDLRIQDLQKGLALKDKQLDVMESDIASRQASAYGQGLSNLWNEYLLFGEGGTYDQNGNYIPIAEGPKATLYKTQQDSANMAFQKLRFMVNTLLPAQANRTKALTDLDKYQKEFMEGKYSAVLDLDLGLGDTVNQWAKMILFMSLAKMF